jgi:hypothetical protein
MAVVGLVLKIIFLHSVLTLKPTHLLVVRTGFTENGIRRYQYYVVLRVLRTTCTTMTTSCHKGLYEVQAGHHSQLSTHEDSFFFKRSIVCRVPTSFPSTYCTVYSTQILYFANNFGYCTKYLYYARERVQYQVR